MCLNPDVITSDSGIMILPVFKELNKINNKFTTPYFNAPIPIDGVLRPTFYLKSKLLVGMDINGGVIHSFINKGPLSCDSDVSLSAYALIPVAAYLSGYYTQEVTSRALYIPELDFSDLKEKRMKLLRGPNDNITIQSLTRLFAFDVDLGDYDEWDDIESNED